MYFSGIKYKTSSQWIILWMPSKKYDEAPYPERGMLMYVKKTVEKLVISKRMFLTDRLINSSKFQYSVEKSWD